MSLLDRVHGGYVARRRMHVLAAHLCSRIPRAARVLDVGCGDGLLAHTIADRRPDVRIDGVDVLVRPEVAIPVAAFDGLRLPIADRSVDVVLLIDVLHHAADGASLLREAARVARDSILIKDHLTDRWLAEPTLRFMDRVGNERHGVTLPYAYRSRREWRHLLSSLDLQVAAWNEGLGLYPWPASALFGGSLHFLARLEPRSAA